MIINIILICISVVCVALLVTLLLVMLKKQTNLAKVDINVDEVLRVINQSNKMQIDSIKNYTDGVSAFLSQNVNMQATNLVNIQNRLEKILEGNEQKLENIKNVISQSLDKLQSDNANKLEQMRQTVDEKLNVSLERRLGESFNLINNRLEAVYKGLGEMQTLASGVGDLKKVLTNVKTRGVWGEMSLDGLLSQILTSEQYKKNVATKPNSQERVDFVIKLPGKDKGEILLPIDAKFPLEDYQRLVDASEKADALLVESCQKALVKRIKDEAKSISDKYINIPNTTDFALMFLPIEGLYAEVVKNAGVVEFVQQNYKVIISGPTTISALLNSLQLGFKTLAIEKRSSEIWKLLGMFRKEFDEFQLLLSKTQKKLEEASNTIDSATKKTSTIAKKLKTVMLPDDEQQIKIDTETCDE